MNESPYKISGANRRLLKKELAELKSIENNFLYLPNYNAKSKWLHNYLCKFAYDFFIMLSILKSN
mgnify:CR=1 FL=1